MNFWWFFTFREQKGKESFHSNSVEIEENTEVSKIERATYLSTITAHSVDHSDSLHGLVRAILTVT